MNGLYPNEQYDPSNSPPRARPYQTQTLPRQASRPSDAFGQDNLYPNDDLSSRYDPNRNYDRLSSMPNYGGYDMGMPSAWNNSGFGQNNHLAALGATQRIKPNARSRNPIPNVSDHFM